ncbi:hypothetical protein AB0C38_40795 [Amycolatopsis sp. NPDC048633]|uniref:hypothetical protein n=1 Tax=Amycolatopsis sp. NPDC048633 TaxID=3157095 RepID=UPI0033EDF9BF
MITVVLVSSIVVLGALAGFFLAVSQPGTDINLELAKVAMNLIAAVLITGGLSAMLARHAADRAQREQKASALAGALRELKAGYECVQMARFFLRARTTGKTFGDQIEVFAKARAHLHRVQRERFVLDSEVDEYVQRMLDYLNGVLSEYQGNYSRITSEGLAEEHLRRRVLDGAEANLSTVPRLPAKEFPAIAGLVDEKNWKKTAFHENYRQARKQLQAWMAG